MNNFQEKQIKHKNLQRLNLCSKGLTFLFGLFPILLFFGFVNFSFAFTSNTKTASSSPSNLKTGLVGHWTFDGSDIVSNVQDKSGNGNTGYMRNMATSSAKVGGKLGQALKFDGTNDYVRVPSTTGGGTTNTATFSAWVYPITKSGYDGVIFYRNTGTPRGLLLDGGATSITYCWECTPDEYNAVTGLTLTNKEWYFVSVVITPTSATVYRIDEKGNVSSWTNTKTHNAYSLDVAYDIGLDNAGRYWDGLIDDVRVYKRSLSLAEIKQLYQMGATKYNAPTASTTPTTLKTGLVGHWTFDGSDIVSNVQDKSGSGNTGYMINMATSSAKVGGKLGQALKFDGVDDRVNTTISSNLSGSFTFSAWIYPTANTNLVQGVITSEVASYGNYWASLGNGTYTGSGGASGSMKFCLYDGSNNPCADTVSALNLNKWVHVVGVRNTATDKLYMYKDGVLIEEATDTTISVPTYSAFNIGGQATQSSRYFPGIVDDAKVYSRVLSASEIKQLYQMGATKYNAPTASTTPTTLKTGLVGHWTFDGSDIVSNVQDKSGNGNTGYMINMATSSAKVGGVLGQAMNFDGNDDYVDIADVDASLVSNSSISVWIKPSTVSVSHRIFGGRTNSAPVVGIYPSPYGIIASGATQGNQRTGSTSTININKWNHLVVTYNSSSIPTIYVNGLEVAYTASTYWGSTNSTIGKGGGGTFRGSIDDLRLYNRILTTQEIKQLYNMGR